MIGAPAPVPVPPLLLSSFTPCPGCPSPQRLCSIDLLLQPAAVCLLLCTGSTGSTSLPHLCNPAYLARFLSSCSFFSSRDSFFFSPPHPHPLPLPFARLFLSLSPSCTTLGDREKCVCGGVWKKKKKPERSENAGRGVKERWKDGGRRVGGETRPFDFSLEAPPYFNIRFNRALMP